MKRLVVGEAGLAGPQHGVHYTIPMKRIAAQRIATHHDHVPPNAQKEQILGIEFDAASRNFSIHPTENH